MYSQSLKANLFLYVVVILISSVFIDARSLDHYHYIDGKCTDTQTKRELFVGEYFDRKDQCVRVQCLGDLTIWEDKCNDLQIKGHCIKEYLNENKPYPGCCPLYKCEDHIGTTKEMKVYDHYGNIVSRSVTNVVFVEDNTINSDTQVHIQAIKILV